MIRVLHFADLVNRHDFIDSIVQRADRSRFEVGVCVRTPKSSIADPVYRADTPRWVLNGVSRRELPHAVWQLARLLRDWQADILHTHHFDQAVIGLLATRLVPRTRLVIGRHYSDAIYRLARGWRRRVLLRLEQLSNHRAARIVVPSSFVARILTDWQNVDPSKVDRIPYGFMPEKYGTIEPAAVERLREELGLRDRLTVVSVGRLDDQKGHRYLIEAMEQLRRQIPESLVLIVGDGPERENLRRQIQDADLGLHVRLLGWRRDVPLLMAAADVVAQPTLQEAFSQVMAEALWMGRPLIMTDVSGATDVLRHGENGLLVEKANTAALAQALLRVATDAGLRERLGTAGRAYARDHLAIEKIIPRYEHVYLKTLGM